MGRLTPPRPLAETDDRDSFDCRSDSLNHWLQRHGWRNQMAGVSRTSVVCDADSGTIVGYVSLAAAQIERAYLPKPDRRNRPDPIPAILIGQLATDKAFQGRGIARSLLRHALAIIVRLSEDIGCFCALTHPFDDDIRAFYRSFGFEDLPGDPGRSMAVSVKDINASFFE